MAKNNIIKTVKELVTKYHTRDPFELCDYLGIKIHYHNLQGRMKGYYVKHYDIANIVIDINLPYEEKNIVCAHELGHHCLHAFFAAGYTDFYKDPGCSISEKEASCFAAELLLEDTSITDLIEDGYNSYEELYNQLSIPNWFLECKLNVMNSKGYHFDLLNLFKADSLSCR